MKIFACPLATANYHVLLWHRHSKPTVGHKYSLAAYKDNVLVGVAIIGRPVARALDDGMTLEVLRVATDGTRNACSALYAEAKRRAAVAKCNLITYTQAHESGASLRAVNALPLALPRKNDAWARREGAEQSRVAAIRWQLYKHEGTQ